MNTIRRLKKN